MLDERLLQLRKEADLTQDELAAILKINKHSISSYERGKSEPSDEIKIAIARHRQTGENIVGKIFINVLSIPCIQIPSFSALKLINTMLSFSCACSFQNSFFLIENDYTRFYQKRKESF